MVPPHNKTGLLSAAKSSFFRLDEGALRRSYYSRCSRSRSRSRSCSPLGGGPPPGLRHQWSAMSRVSIEIARRWSLSAIAAGGRGVAPRRTLLGGAGALEQHAAPSARIVVPRAGVRGHYSSFVSDDGQNHKRPYHSFVDDGDSKKKGGGEDAPVAKETVGVKCCDKHGEPGHTHEHGKTGSEVKADKRKNGEMDAESSVIPYKDVLLEDDESDESPVQELDKNPLWNQEPLDYLLDNNKRWVQWKVGNDPDFFKKLSASHKPEFLYIGCSDARLSVQHMLGLELGQLFVHRNVANMVINTDMGLNTGLSYAVEYLKVKNILLCGHYDCGGVRAAMQNVSHGNVDMWIMGIRDVVRMHKQELSKLTDEEAFHRRLVELNVREQALKLFANPIVQKSQALYGFPHIHAYVYDVADGYLHELDFNFRKAIRQCTTGSFSLALMTHFNPPFFACRPPYLFHVLFRRGPRGEGQGNRQGKLATL
jgi:carbonic anhydrase